MNSDPSKDPHKGLFNTLNKAVLNAQSQKWRTSADFYRKTYSKAPDSFPYKYYALSGYASILRMEQARATDDDIRFFEKLSANTQRPTYEVVEACFVVGFLSWVRGDRERAGRFYRKCIASSHRMTTPERQTLLNVGKGDQTAESLVENTVKQATENVEVLEGKRTNVSDATASGRLMGVPFGPLAVDTDRQGKLIMESLSISRRDCFYCGSGEKTLLCRRCENSYYCSKECQKKDWKKHKTSCRSPKDFKKGDIVRVQGLVKHPQENGKILIVLSKSDVIDDDVTMQRWVVNMIGGRTKGILIKAKNLFRVVSAEVYHSWGYGIDI